MEEKQDRTPVPQLNDLEPAQQAIESVGRAARQYLGRIPDTGELKELLEIEREHAADLVVIRHAQTLTNTDEIAQALAIIDNRKNNALARRGAETALGNQQKAVYLNRATALILVAVGLYAVHVGIVVGIGLFIIGCGLFMINPEYVNNYLKDFIKTVGGVTNDKNNNSRD